MDSKPFHEAVSLHDLMITGDKTAFGNLCVIGRIKDFNASEALLKLQCVESLCVNNCILTVDVSLTNPMKLFPESLLKVFGELSSDNILKAKIITVVDGLDVISYHKAIRARENFLKQRQNHNTQII